MLSIPPSSFYYLCFGLLLISWFIKKSAAKQLTPEQTTRLTKSIGPHPIWVIRNIVAAAGMAALMGVESKTFIPSLVVIFLAIFLLLTLAFIITESRRKQRLGIPATYLRTLAIAELLSFLALAAIGCVVIIAKSSMP